MNRGEYDAMIARFDAERAAIEADAATRVTPAEAAMAAVEQGAREEA